MNKDRKIKHKIFYTTTITVQDQTTKQYNTTTITVQDQTTKPTN